MVKKNIDMMLMRFNEADAVKIFANTYWVLRILYFNELHTYSERKGLNKKQIIEGIRERYL